jgi:hypothetical protein
MNSLLSPVRHLRSLFCTAALFLGGSLHAQLIMDVTLDTSALVGHPAGPFYIDFQLNDGMGIGDANNTALLGNFNFGGGSAEGAASLFGGVTGSLATTVTLHDTEAFNEFFQAFTPGAFFSFRLSLSTAVSGPTPDLFSFAILDSNLANIPTYSFGNDAFFQVDITDANADVQVFASDESLAPSAGGLPIAIDAPYATPVPEPSTYGLIGAVILSGLALWRRRSMQS